MPDSKCPLCNQETTIALYTVTKDYQNAHDQTSYKAYKCSECNIIFQYPFPNEEDFDNLYPDDYYAHSEDDNIPFLTKVLDSILQKKITILSPIKKSIYPYLEIIKQANKILDIGCGKGLFLDVLKKNGKETYGLEPDLNAVEILKKKGHHATQGNISASPYESNYFDLITMFQVFEHIEDPSTLINEVYRILKPGGYFIIETPNIESDLASNKNLWRSLEFPRHLILHSPKSISNLLKNANFSPNIFIRVSPTDIRETYFLRKKTESAFKRRLCFILMLPHIIIQYIFRAKKGSLLIAVAKK